MTAVVKFGWLSLPRACIQRGLATCFLAPLITTSATLAQSNPVPALHTCIPGDIGLPQDTAIQSLVIGGGGGGGLFFATRRDSLFLPERERIFPGRLRMGIYTI